MLRRAVIVDALRTPVARASSDSGWFRDVRSEELSAHILRGLVDRSGIDPGLIDEVRWGCVQQQGEQGYNIARIASLVAGLPVGVCGVTVNRNCASSLQAIHDAATSIAVGASEVEIAGGVEHMGRVPLHRGVDPSPALIARCGEPPLRMGQTAEYLATKYRISREDQDTFALRSHRLAAEAADGGVFAAEITPTRGRDDFDRRAEILRDQGVRRDASIHSLASLQPAFRPVGGTVTAGNSSPLSVGSAAILIMSEEKAEALGFRPMARIRAIAVVGVEPAEMGIGPVPAIRKALARAGLNLDEIDAIEINEAFAVQVLAVLGLLDIHDDRVNRRGGALAIGHPLGASGARIVTTLLHRMRDEGGRLGLAAMCVGHGQGVATVFETC